MKKLTQYFSKTELVLWISSVILITVSFLLFDRSSYLTLIASLLGVTSLIYCAKGNPIGSLLMIIFCILYGIISYSFDYYGEMITYLGMSLPMSVVCFISWYKNPFKGNHAEVTVSSIKAKDLPLIGIFVVIVTVVFYFILEYFQTANLIPSAISVATSLLAVCLTAKRSPYFALAYAANDLVLIVLWVLASFTDITYISVVICFVVFFVNDLYGFYNWLQMKKHQQESES